MIGIYRISCTQEPVVYIGSSIDINRRWVEHKKHLNKDKHTNYKLQLAWNAYGDESFIFEVLDLTKELIIKEQLWLDKYWPNCYNLSPSAWNPMRDLETVKKNIESVRKNGKRGKQKLNEEQVVQIKTMLRDKLGSIKEIAKQFDVSGSTIASIKTGSRWGSIKVDGFLEGKNKTAKDCEDIILELYSQGVKVEKIREICLLKGATSIYNVLKRNNVETNRVHH